MKKKEKEVEEVKVVEPKITTLGVDFGREDLNLLVKKVNEIIDYLNG